LALGWLNEKKTVCWLLCQEKMPAKNLPLTQEEAHEIFLRGLNKFKPSAKIENNSFLIFNLNDRPELMLVTSMKSYSEAYQWAKKHSSTYSNLAIAWQNDECNTCYKFLLGESEYGPAPRPVQAVQTAQAVDVKQLEQSTNTTFDPETALKRLLDHFKELPLLSYKWYVLDLDFSAKNSIIFESGNYDTAYNWLMGGHSLHDNHAIARFENGIVTYSLFLGDSTYLHRIASFQESEPIEQKPVSRQDEVAKSKPVLGLGAALVRFHRCLPYLAEDFHSIFDLDAERNPTLSIAKSYAEAEKRIQENRAHYPNQVLAWIDSNNGKDIVYYRFFLGDYMSHVFIMSEEPSAASKQEKLPTPIPEKPLALKREKSLPIAPKKKGDRKLLKLIELYQKDFAGQYVLFSLNRSSLLALIDSHSSRRELEKAVDEVYAKKYSDLQIVYICKN
jgi:hypothetical protein